MTASGRKEAGRSQEKGPEPNQEQKETPRTHHSQAGPTSRSEYAGPCWPFAIKNSLYFKFLRVTDSDRERKMNENLEGVGQILGNLKGMATNMGAEISRQNDQLDVIQGKVTFDYLSFISIKLYYS